MFTRLFYQSHLITKKYAFSFKKNLTDNFFVHKIETHGHKKLFPVKDFFHDHANNVKELLAEFNQSNHESFSFFYQISFEFIIYE